ncbi:flagellar biosynthesis anti-sigma factor FlgM [Croceibacterium sp. LX-88]|uniref:Flagellar biosynthesis anti-sigma factor FlgM n=1 Tax=Croceibacterium selenioxidans TaxID=2838833 RepID=A0ABS5W0I1_9SPHN|nr:flagellar biosynthesis anti-sigma factor FlgM [Croceibacterium selenioxidans]MBT2133214.1 flagellar biosynthesis anti-sigma factor FlgM [Croceibacterium selenioxidans]
MRPIETSGLSGITPRITGAGATPVNAVARVRPVESREQEGLGEVALSAASAGESAPVDIDRVEQIRQAIEEGHYPIVPMKVADAMIAAGILLRTKP